MTNKEAKEKLYMEWQKFLEDNIDYAGISKAYQTAFKALEQEPCDDAISRQAVLDKKELVELEDGQSFYCISPEDIETLPPVTPQPKTGNWIPVSERLPERNVEVLVTTEWDCITIGEMFSSNDWFIHEGATNADIDDIKAWMPLPPCYDPQESEE